MDVGKLAYIKAKELEKAQESGAMGRTTPRPPIVYDGSGTELIDLLGTGETFVKISDTPISLEGAVRVYLETERGYIRQLDNVVYGIEGGVLSALLISDEVSEDYFAVNVLSEFDGLSVGTYIKHEQITGDVFMWTSRIEFEDTIHPIDPKFLPDVGGGRTTINLTEYGITGPGQSVSLTDEQFETLAKSFKSRNAEFITVADDSLQSFVPSIWSATETAEFTSYLTYVSTPSGMWAIAIDKEGSVNQLVMEALTT